MDNQQQPAPNRLEEIETLIRDLRRALDECDYDNEIADIYDSAHDALVAQPDLLDALRAAQYALRLAYETAPVKAPSPTPALLPQSEPQREIELALKQVTAVLDHHLA